MDDNEAIQCVDIVVIKKGKIPIPPEKERQIVDILEHFKKKINNCLQDRGFSALLLSSSLLGVVELLIFAG